MSLRAGAGRAPLILAGASAAFGWLIYAILPATIYTLDDDFGYLRSIVGTAQRHRPWTHGFLEPWSAAHSLFAAGAYWLTHDFHFATYGLHAIYAAFSCAALCALLRARSFSIRSAILLAGVMLTSPVMLWRALEFTDMALYLPCLFAAIWGAENRRWLVFGLAWGCAVSTRQSAVVWLAWPAAECIPAFRDRRSDATRSWRAPALVLILGGGVLLLLAEGMNVTAAQRMRLLRTLQEADPRSAAWTLALGTCVIAAAIGLAASLSRLSARPARPGLGLRDLAVGALGGAAASTFWFVSSRHVIMDHVSFTSRQGLAYTGLVFALSTVGWIGMRRFSLRPGPLFCAFASVGMLCLRPGLWDYYLVDAAWFGFFSLAIPERQAPQPERTPQADFASVASITVALSLAALFHLKTARDLWRLMDDAVARCVIYEDALRAGRVVPLELRSAPFGFRGWHLYEYAKARQPNRRWMSETLFPPKNTLLLEILPASIAAADCAPPGRLDQRLLAEQTFRIGFEHFRYRLSRLAPPPPPSDAAPPPVRFPLTNQEWRELIDHPAPPQT